MTSDPIALASLYVSLLSAIVACVSAFMTWRQTQLQTGSSHLTGLIVVLVSAGMVLCGILVFTSRPSLSPSPPTADPTTLGSTSDPYPRAAPSTPKQPKANDVPPRELKAPFTPSPKPLDRPPPELSKPVTPPARTDPLVAEVYRHFNFRLSEAWPKSAPDMRLILNSPPKTTGGDGGVATCTLNARVIDVGGRHIVFDNDFSAKIGTTDVVETDRLFEIACNIVIDQIIEIIARKK